MWSVVVSVFSETSQHARKVRVVIRLARMIARVLGLDVAAFDAEIERIRGMSTEQLREDNRRKLREICDREEAK